MTDASSPLVANLLALRARSPELFARLSLPVAGEHTRVQDEGVFYRRQQQWYLLDDLAEPLMTVDEAGADGDTFLFGMGAGDHLARFLADHPDGRVTVWDRDPWLLLLALSRFDFSQALATGRLTLLLGIDLLAAREAFAACRLLLHPLLHRVYRRELALLRGPPRDAIALVRDGGLYVDDLAAFLDQAGHGVYTLDTEGLSRQELLHVVSVSRACLMASINYQNGLAEFCREAGIPLHCWEIDPFTDRLAPLQGGGDHVHLFSYRKANVVEFQRRGFCRAAYLPLAANLATRRPPDFAPGERARYHAPVAFVGASLVAEARQHQETLLRHYVAWRGGDPGAARREGEVLLEQVAVAARADYAHNLLPRLMAEHFGPFLAAMGDGGVDFTLLAGERIACEKRLTYVSALGSLGMHVWGDEGWRLTEVHGVRYAGRYAGHGEELAKVYAAAAVNIDINRAYQPEIVTLRVFDVLACGGFLLAEYSDDLAELFRLGEEVVVYRDLDELRELTVWYLNHPEAARAMAKRGRQAVVERHDLQERFRLIFGTR